MCLKCHRLFWVLLLCLPAVVWADAPGFVPPDLTLKVWTKQQGLPDDAVTAILQTHDGYLWIGTAGGLARFDGVRFVPVSPAGLATNETLRVTALCEDAAGRLWVGTRAGGLFRYGEGVLEPFPASDGKLDRTINSIAEDGAGNLWLGTPSGLCVLEKDRILRFTVKDGLVNDFVSNVYIARSGIIWITTRGGLCQFKNGQIIPFPFQTDSPGRNPESLGVYEDVAGQLWAFGDTYLVNLTEGKRLNYFGGGNSLSSLRIWSLCEGRHGELWIGTSGKGLYCFTQDKFLPASLRGGGLASDVRALCMDREGNLWVGTDGGGLVRLQPRNVRVLDASVGLPARPVTCLALDRQGRMLIGFDHGGLYAGEAERFAPLAAEAGANPQNLVSSLAVAEDDSVWVGTPGAGLYCLDHRQMIHYGTANGLADDLVLAVTADSLGAVWAGTASGGLSRIAGGKLKNFQSSGLPRQPITALLPARNGDLWIGYGDGRVFRGRAEGFQPVIESPVFGGRAIRALHEDAAGRLWLGTAGGRLACLMPGRYLDWNLGLPASDEAILGLLSDDDGDLWLATGNAVYHLPQGEIAAALTRQAPLRSQLVFEADAGPGSTASYGWPRAVRAPDGKFWFGGASGVVIVNPRRTMVDLVPLPVLIEDVTVNGQPLPRRAVAAAGAAASHAPVTARLPSNLRSLDLQFTALNFSEPEKIRFRHKLDGSDPDWVEGGTDRGVHYGHLAYGAYIFRVQAGMAGAWNKNEATFDFVIPTPLGLTVWAETFYVLAGITLVAAIARVVSNRRLRHRLALLAQQRALERERMRIAQNMHDEIGSKLTKISFMSERAKGELHERGPVTSRLESIARTSRDLLQSLDEIVWAVNPHNDTLEHLAAYLGHYATEYLQNTAVECELHLPPNLPDYPLSSETRHNLFLAFEESLNNALKHSRATRIQVKMRASPKEFEITIEDNGCGFEVEAVASLMPGTVLAGGKRVGNGLRNLQQRLAEVGGRCHIRSRPGQGTVVTLAMPLAAAGGFFQF